MGVGPGARFPEGLSNHLSICVVIRRKSHSFPPTVDVHLAVRLCDLPFKGTPGYVGTTAVTAAMQQHQQQQHAEPILTAVRRQVVSRPPSFLDNPQI